MIGSTSAIIRRRPPDDGATTLRGGRDGASLDGYWRTVRPLSPVSREIPEMLIPIRAAHGNAEAPTTAPCAGLLHPPPSAATPPDRPSRRALFC